LIKFLPAVNRKGKSVILNTSGDVFDVSLKNNVLLRKSGLFNLRFFAILNCWRASLKKKKNYTF